MISDKVFWCGWVFRRKLAIVLALLSFSVTRTCIAETLIKLLVELKFACNHHEGLGYLYLSGVLISTASVTRPLSCTSLCYLLTFFSGMEEQREEVRAAYQELREHYPALPEQLRDFQVGP